MNFDQKSQQQINKMENHQPGRLKLILYLIGKEFSRLIRNGSAMLAIGLMIVISLLLVVSEQKKQKELQATVQTKMTASSVCWIIYGKRTDWIKYLQANPERRLPIRIISKNKAPALNVKNGCAVEVQGHKNKLIYHFTKENRPLFDKTLHWFLQQSISYFGHKPAFKVVNHPIVKKATNIENSQEALRSKLMQAAENKIGLIGSMMLFTVQFFICCALLVSFTSQERESGILQAVSLTPVRFSDMYIARILFHLLLSLAVSTIIVFIIKKEALNVPALWVTLLLTSLGLASVGMIISSLSRTQTTASLFSFAYLMLIGLIAFLATDYSLFSMLKSLTFEHYSFTFLFLSLSDLPGLLAAVLHADLLKMLLSVTMLLVISIVLFRKRGWQQL